jgi:hypothetical protein
MNHTIFYPTMENTIPNTLYTAAYLKHGPTIPRKNLVLTNDYLLEKGISAMTLSVVKFAAIDDNGAEHLIKTMESQLVNIKGMYTRRYITTDESVELPEGNYTTLRFYLNQEGINSLIFNDRSQDHLKNSEYLDFKIKDGLKVIKGEEYALKLNFNFLPFTVSSYFNPVKDFFKKPKEISTKLVRSFGS